MVLRFLRQLARFLSRLYKTRWDHRTGRPPGGVVRMWVFLLKFVKSRFVSVRCLGIIGWGGTRGVSLQDSRAGSKRDIDNKQCGSLDPESTELTVVSCSLHPHFLGDHVVIQPGPPVAPGSLDTQSIHSPVDAIGFTLETPQSPRSAQSGEEKIHVEGPIDSPRYSTGSLDTEQDNIPNDEQFDHLEAPRRQLARPASSRSGFRSTSPSVRSSVMLHPGPASSNISFRRSRGPSLLHPSRSPSPLNIARSLRPVPSRVSIRSQFSARQTRPPSVIEQEPPPLPIIEPEILSEDFEDTEGRIWTLAPEMVDRYDRKIFATKNEQETILEPLTMRFEPPWNPKGWKPIVHPEGQLYFWHSEKRIVTEAYLYNRDVYRQLHYHLSKIESFIERTRLHSRLKPYDLVLDLLPHKEGGYFCGYYFVNHEERSIFWLQQYDASDLAGWDPAAGHKSKLHLKHEIEAQYWYHCQLFPTTLTLNVKLVSELRDIILHNIADTMTSVSSTAPYSHEDFNKMLGWVNSLKKNLEISYAGSACLVGRLMYIFAHERFLHFYGEPVVRLRRGYSVYGTVHRRTLLIRTLSPLLFAAPLQHLMALEKIWVDEIIHEPTWKVLIQKFNKQWEEFILFATVMLNANMAFLAIQSVDEQTPPKRNPGQIASYLSIVASIGSIIIGLLLIKMNRVRLQDTAPDALRFIDERHSKVLGLEILAIVYGLPFALLMWGMIAFLVAFCLMCFSNSTAVTRGIVGSACILAGFLVGWCIWIGWDKHIHMQPEELHQTIIFAEDEKNEDTGNGGDTDETVISMQQVRAASLTRQRTGSPLRNGDPQAVSEDSPDQNSAAQHRLMYHQLKTKWKGLWRGQLGLGLRSDRAEAHATLGSPNTNAIV